MTGLLLIHGCSDQALTRFNASPEAPITAPADGASVLEGYATLFRGSVSDPDHQSDELTASWFSATQELCPPATPDAEGITTCEVILGVNESSVTLEARDPENASASAHVDLTVTPTDAPTAEITSPNLSGTYYSDLKVVFEGVVANSEDEESELTVSWSSDLDGVLELDTPPDSSGNVLGSAYLTEGDHTVTLQVEDTTGKIGTTSALVSVGPPNSAPTCDLLAPADGSASALDTALLLEAVVDDVDIGPERLQVSWISDYDGTLGESVPNSDGTVSFSTVGLTVATHTITVSVSDELGTTCTDSVLHTVGTAPEIDLQSSVSGDITSEADPTYFLASISDGQDLPTDVALEWSSDLDGLLSTQGADSDGMAEFYLSDLSVGLHALTLKATDPVGLYGQATASFTVNGVPGAPVISISPSLAKTADSLSVNIDTESTDPEGDPVTYAVEWSVGGVGFSSSASVAASDTQKGETWTVTVTPSDSYGAGEAATASITIENTAPVLSSVSLTPNPGATAVDMTWSPGSATDDDGDSVSFKYAWTVSGSAVSETSATLDASAFEKGDTVRCDVTPADRTDDGAVVSSRTVTIENTAPSTTSVAISPDPANATDSLTCSWSGFSDPDGDSDLSTVAWTQNGSAAGSGTTFSGTLTRGDTIICAVTPDDGTDTGATLTNRLLISNARPEVVSVSITPDPALTDDTLSTSVSTTDPDSDSVSVSYQWSVNSSPVSTGTTLSSSLFSKGDEVTVEVTPYDGRDYGDTVLSGIRTISNTPPEAPVVSIQPGSPSESDDLVCTIDTEAYDADGDDVEYDISWEVDGSPYVAGGDIGDTGGADFLGPTTTTIDNDTVPSEDTLDGMEWTCTVTPYDDTDVGDTASDSVTVEVLDYSDLWTLDSTVSYTCAFGIGVNFSFSNITVTDSGSSISVLTSAAQPGTLTGTFITDTIFSANNTIVGLCNESYAMVGEFTDGST